MNTTSTTLSAPTTVPAEEHLPQWHVMTHLEMARFQKWFSNVNAMRLRDGLPVIQDSLAAEASEHPGILESFT